MYLQNCEWSAETSQSAVGASSPDLWFDWQQEVAPKVGRKKVFGQAIYWNRIGATTVGTERQVPNFLIHGIIYIPGPQKFVSKTSKVN
jgi:hypothetical protein